MIKNSKDESDILLYEKEHFNNENNLIALAFLIFLIFMPSLDFPVSIGPKLPTIVDYLFSALQFSAIFLVSILIIFPYYRKNTKLLYIVMLTFFVVIFLIYFIYILPSSYLGSTEHYAVEEGAQDILALRDPYLYPTKVLNAPKSQFPGEFLLAIPFVLFGLPMSVLFALGLLAIITLIIFESDNIKHWDQKMPFVIVALFIPFTLFSIKWGFDFFVVVPIQLLSLKFLMDDKKYLAAFLFGFTLACREQYWIVIPSFLIYAYINKESIKEFIYVTLITFIVPFIIIIPFILWNPTIFFTYAPLGSSSSKFHASPYFIAFSFLISNPYLVTISLFLLCALISLFMTNGKQLILIQAVTLFFLIIILQMGTQYESENYGYMLYTFIYGFAKSKNILLEKESIIIKIKKYIQSKNGIHSMLN